MSDIPTPRSYNQILGDMIDAFLSRYGLGALKTGTPILSALEATAQSQLRSSEDIFTLLEAQSLDQASGIALDRIGADESLARITESAASGLVRITDTSITKVSSKVFQGTSAPIIGSTTINVTDASAFTASGSVYLGRGTNNYEGPLAYTSILPPGSGLGQSGGAYYSLVLASGTLRFHNVGESVVLAQGGSRDIAAGSTVQTPQGNAVSAVQFKTRFLATIPDGETAIEGVQVLAQKPGIIGNISANSISEFSPAGFSVTNPLPFTNGLAAEDDESYRERIRAARQSRSKGTPLALQTAAIGVTSTDENKRVLSASVVAQSGLATVLYIDDGTGYEEADAGVAIESLTDYAQGGESFFKVSGARPIAKAFALTSLTAPFALTAGDKLAVLVGGVLTEHTFDTDEFFSIDNASAYEVSSSINSNPDLLWSARTYNNGTQVAIFAKADSNESVQVTTPNGDNANDSLGFTTTRVDTMRLYKDDRLLTKDGALASITSNATSLWIGLSGTQSLVISVDGVQLSFDDVQFDKFSGQDFIDADTGYSTLGQNTPEAWAKVFSYRIPGVTATAVSGKVVLVSNRGRSANASLEVISGTLVTNKMFDTAVSVGASNDYTLDRNTGELRLVSALVAGSRLSTGSTSTRAFLETDPITLLSVTDPVLWFAVDADATRVLSGLTASTALAFENTDGEVFTWGSRVRVKSTTADPLFANVAAGDWAVFWDPASPTGLGEYRVSTVDPVNGKFFEIDLKQGLAGRYAHRMTALDDGTFLITGGFVGPTTFTSNGDANVANSVSATCEIYNPVTGAFTVARSMSNARAWHTATKLADGRVLVTGGQASLYGLTGTCEIYDPTSNTWTNAASLALARAQHEAVLTNANTVLVAGGCTGLPNTVTNSTVIYTPGSNSWAASGNLAAARRHFCMALFTTSGNVMVAGGDNGATVLQTLERWVAGVWSNIGNLNGGVRCHLRAVATSGTVVKITGGSSALSTLQDVPVAATESYTDGGAISAGPAMAFARARHGMCLLNGGDIVVFGGVASNSTGRPERLSAGVWSNIASPIATNNETSGANRFGTQLAAVPGTNDFFAVGGQAESPWPWNFASVETYVAASTAWFVRNPFLTTSVALTEAGLQFVRSNAPLQRVAIPAGTNYTAATLADEISTRLVGATSSIYRTTTLRVRTNTFNDVADVQTDLLAGDIGVLAENTDGATIGLPSADATANITGHTASVESDNPEHGTPDFHQAAVLSSTSTSQFAFAWSKDLLGYNLQSQPDYIVSNLVVGLRADDDWRGTTSFVNGPTWSRYGGVKDFITSIQSRSDNSFNADSLTLLDTHAMGYLFQDRFYLAAPYQLGPEDQLTVLVDGDVEQKRFTIPMWRKFTPNDATYGASNVFMDGDNANLSLAIAFGAGPFDFTDFAVFMPARAIAQVDLGTESILWRYYRLGPDGNSARVRFVYPDAESSALAVNTTPELLDFSNYYTWTNVDVVLGSGALRTGYGINSATTIAEVRPASGNNLATVFYIFAYPIATAQRTANVTTLTLTLPAGVTNHGLSDGDTYHVVSTSGSFTSGDKVITSHTATTITYAETAADAGPVANAGRVYLGAGQTGDISGAGVQQHDFFRLETAASTNAGFEGFTTRIINDPASNPYWIEGSQPWLGSIATSTTPTLYTLGDSTAFKIFANLKQSAAAIVTAVNALETTINGTNLDAGSGLIFKSSADISTQGYYRDELTDGVNYIKSVTQQLITGYYVVTFKNDVNPTLVSADWLNETVRVVPRTAKNVVDWLSTGAVSGLYTVATTELSSRAHKVQISSLTAGSLGSVQVQGGTANTTTAPVVGSSTVVGSGGVETMYVQIATADTQGLFAGQYVAIDNTVLMPKVDVFQSTSTLQYVKRINGGGQFNVDVGVYTLRTPKTANAQVRVEQQGRFMHYTSTSGGTAIDATNVQEGDWVRIASVLDTAVLGAADQVSAVNQGVYRVVRVIKSGAAVDGSTFTSFDGGRAVSFWVENPNGTNQGVAECDLQFFTPDSMLVADTVTFGSDAWGAGNRGDWTIKSVGSAASVVPAGGLVRVTNVVTVTLPNTSPIYLHNLNVGDYFDLSPGETDFAEGRYVVTNVVSGYVFQYADTAADATSAGIQSVVGLPFQNRFVFTVDNATATSEQIDATAADLGTASPLFQCHEGTPGRYIKQIQAVSPNPNDTALSDVKFNTAQRNSQIGEAPGSILTVLDKLGFSTDLKQGLDGYKHATGLIAEVNRVIYGDSDDTATYPGVAAAGATVNIQGPLVKRVSVSLGVRVRSGAPKADIADRVKSAVASVINQYGVGQSISLSSIINAASAVPGVVAITPINPVLTSGSDLITVQAYEKPLVINLDQDVTVSFVGD